MQIRSSPSTVWPAVLTVIILPLLVITALTLGRDAQGWYWATGELANQLLPWRLPRIMAAAVSGMLLGAAGCLIQRLTGNPMASPEVLGISSGAACGVVVMLFMVPGDAWQWLIPAGTIGALLTLLLIVAVGGRGGVSPQRMLLAGVSLSALFSTLILLFMASGDPRIAGLMTWLSGSTYQVDMPQARRVTMVGAALLLLIPLGFRWLTLLPLGEITARASGVPLMPARLLLLLLAAALTATATFITGPLSFIGLMAPHLARMLGFYRITSQLTMAVLLGAGIMIIADWCGRMIFFPDQIPAGLLATFIGAPYFIWLLRRV
ncbi:MAG: Iron(3+)-hydroxamate import system permease protein FhuB [Candidatus Erwinia impunctatus]|nr:Iron(3+)-hydroxamate import system permease protein FhuB [Culicoides impunctatus]